MAMKKKSQATTKKSSFFDSTKSNGIDSPNKVLDGKVSKTAKPQKIGNKITPQIGKSAKAPTGQVNKFSNIGIPKKKKK